MSESQQDDEFQENLIKLYQVLGSAKAVADNLDISILDVYCVLKKYKLSIEERMQMSASNTSILGANGSHSCSEKLRATIRILLDNDGIDGTYNTHEFLKARDELRKILPKP